MEKEKIIEELVEELIASGLATREESSPEGGFWGRQTRIRPTLAGAQAGLVLRRNAAGCWAGEVPPLVEIRLGGQTIWRAERD